MKIIEYTTVIVTSRNAWELGEQVTNKIRKGFQPYGYPCVAGANNGRDERDGNQAEFLLVQAMVRYED